MPDCVELVKLAVRPRYSCAIWIFAISVLYLDLPDLLKISQFRVEFAPYIGAAAVFFFIIWIIELILLFWIRATEAYSRRMEHNKLIDSLKSLNTKEQMVLARHLLLRCTSLKWTKTDPEIVSLVHKGLLHQTFSNSPFSVPHIVDERVWCYLQTVKDQFIADARASNPNEPRLQCSSDTDRGDV